MTLGAPIPTGDVLDGKRTHPLAALFPPMSDDEFAAICEDVKANGLVEPVILLDGEILDGVHRLKACLQAGVEPRYQDWTGEGGTPLQYVWSRNWTRRHLSAGQRAVISLAAEKELAKAAARRLSPKARTSGVERMPPVAGTGKARDQAGQLAGVNPRYVQDAKSLEKASPTLLEKVRLGHLTLPAAVRQAKRAGEKPAGNNPTHRVRIEVGGHALQSERLSEAEAATLHEELVKMLEGKNVAVRTVGRCAAVSREKAKPAHGTGEWAKSNVNLLNGCQHDCHYCYAKDMAVRHDRATPDSWKTPIVNRDALNKNFKKRKGAVMSPSSHDIHPENLDDYLTVLRKLLVAGNKVVVVSKPHQECVARLCSELQAFKPQILFRFTIGSADDKVLRAWEPNAPSFAERVACLRHAHEQGFQTSVSCEPMLDANIDAVIASVKPYVTDAIWIGRANDLNRIVAVTSPGDQVVRERAKALTALMSDDYLKALWARLHTDPMFKWKDSVKEALKLERPTEKGLDV